MQHILGHLLGPLAKVDLGALVPPSHAKKI